MVTVSESVEVKPDVVGSPVPKAGEPSPPVATLTAPSVKDTPEFLEALRAEMSGRDRKIKQSTSETAKIKAEAEALRAELAANQAEHDEAMSQFLSEDPDAKKAYLDRRQIAKDKRALIAEKADVERQRYENEKFIFDSHMAQRRRELVAETGISISELEDCETEADMEVKALRYQRQKEKSQPPIVDSGISDGLGGVDLDKLSPREKIEKGLEKARGK